MSRPNRTRLKNASLENVYICDTYKRNIDRNEDADTSLTDALNRAKGVLIADPAIKVAPFGSYKGNFFGWDLYNEDVAPVFIHFFDAATKGAVTIGTTKPLKTIKIPAQGAWAYLSTDPALFNFKNGLVAFATSDFLATAEVNAQVFGTFYYWDNN